VRVSIGTLATSATTEVTITTANTIPHYKLIFILFLLQVSSSSIDTRNKACGTASNHQE